MQLNLRTLVLGFPVYSVLFGLRISVLESWQNTTLYRYLWLPPYILSLLYSLMPNSDKIPALLTVGQNHWMQKNLEIMPLNGRPFLLLSLELFPVFSFLCEWWCLGACGLRSRSVWFLNPGSWVVSWVFCLYKRCLGVPLYRKCSGSVPTFTKMNMYCTKPSANSIAFLL